jgi:Integrase core domain.
MSRRAPEIVLTDEEKDELNRLVRGQRTEQRYVTRARIVRESSKGLENKEIAQKLNLNKMTVGKWRRNFKEKRLEGLKDEPRPGRPLTYDANARANIIEMACNSPPNTTRWTVRDLTRTLNEQGISISKSQLNQILNELDLKPHQFRTWLQSKDPDFERKELKIIGLYMNPPENAVVISVDEKTRIQDREPINPSIPMKPGCPKRQDPTYKRHEYTSLLAALFVHKGEIYGKPIERHRSQEFIEFLEEINSIIDPEKEVHLIVDNFSAHTSGDVKKWAVGHKRFRFYYTPTHASWLNQIELWFSILGRKLLNHIEARSVDELVQKIMGFIDYYNETAHPFAWTYKGKVLNI